MKLTSEKFRANRRNEMLLPKCDEAADLIVRMALKPTI